jgi:hypothetical protein
LEDHSEPVAPAIEVKTLPRQIGELSLVNEFLSGRSAKRDCCRAQNDERPFARVAPVFSIISLYTSAKFLSASHYP